MTYKEAVKLLRKKMIVTQTELGDLLGVSFGTVNRWEAGTYKPTTKIKGKLASMFKEYEVKVDE